MNAVCERLAEAKSLPYETPIHVFTGIIWCSAPDFVVPFELMIITDCVRHMESGVDTVNSKRTMERVKNITLVEKHSFHSLNVSNTWNIPSRHKKLLVTSFNCDTEDHITPKCPLHCN